MIASILTIGDEILIGQIINNNASYIANALNSIGIRTKTILTVGDNENDILIAYDRLLKEHDVVITTGGLGPTQDDITKNSLCKYFGVELIVNTEVKANIERILSSGRMSWNEAADEQTLVPQGCKIIFNKHGTAPGIIIEKYGKYIISLPGVPYEMQQMMDDNVVHFLKEIKKDLFYKYKTFRTTGVAEVYLSNLIKGIDFSNHNASIAFLPSPYGVDLRLTITDVSKEETEQNLDKLEAQLKQRINDYIYSIDKVEMEEVLGKLLVEKNMSIAVAESCTGGLISNRLTDVPGSSKYFECSIVSYSNRSKKELLNVRENLIDQYGAVSEQVAIAMAEGIKKLSGSDIGLSTTGIAGPTGATQEKPIGLVWIGYADNTIVFAKRYFLGEDRKLVKIRASQAAMELVRRILLGIKLEV